MIASIALTLATEGGKMQKERYCKIGTVPMLVYVDGRYPVEVGKRIRFREARHGSSWQFARVEIVHDDGWFLATL